MTDESSEGLRRALKAIFEVALDRADAAEAEAASESRWAEQYKRERDAAEAKLAAVRKSAENIIWALDQRYDHALAEARAGLPRILAILDAEPPTATVQPTAEGGEPNV